MTAKEIVLQKYPDAIVEQVRNADLFIITRESMLQPGISEWVASEELAWASAAEKIAPAPALRFNLEDPSQCIAAGGAMKALHEAGYVVHKPCSEAMIPNVRKPQPSESVGAQELHEGARIVSSALLYLNHQTPKNWAAEGILNSLWGGLAKEYFETKYKPAPQQSESLAAESFQRRVELWCLACFGPEITMDRRERNHRFLEEALELVQAIGCTESEAQQLVSYVFSRPTGEPFQELGGVLVTLNALATAFPMPVDYCGEKELTRVWGKIEKIRAKQAVKPKHSPLPESAAADRVFLEIEKRRSEMTDEQRDSADAKADAIMDGVAQRIEHRDSTPIDAGSIPAAVSTPYTPAADELPPLGRSRTFWTSDATEEELATCLNGKHPALLYRLLEEREEQLLAARAEMTEVQRQFDALTNRFAGLTTVCGHLRQRAEYAEGLVAKREADHKTDLQRIQESYSSGSQPTK